MSHLISYTVTISATFRLCPYITIQFSKISTCPSGLHETKNSYDSVKNRKNFLSSEVFQKKKYSDDTLFFSNVNKKSKQILNFETCFNSGVGGDFRVANEDGPGSLP
jgi:hypothetical protein